MKYRVIAISTLLFFFPLFALASPGEEPRLALTTYSSSEVSTGGIQVGAGGSASSGSGSAGVEVTNTLNANNGSGVVEVKVETEVGGVVQKESIKKTISPGEGFVQVFVATSSGSLRAAAQVKIVGTSSTTMRSATASPVFHIRTFFQLLPHPWLERLRSIFWFF
ncbi:MAG: hypothetical protein G01um101456_515 [Parcubacteria group bacterium Gr01-1014_56]|nr:MAG: hypothetical protein G01um101456_515 [Parcubacteria group bacterium Gr01-1014_56]